MAEHPAKRTLAEVQAQFYALVTAPVAVARALEQRGIGVESIEATIVGDRRLSAVARLDIYANMYFFRILDVLREAYPKLLAALGDDPFHNLVTDYLVACPPAHPSLAQVGERLPRFLAGHRELQARPWLAELARLERCHLELFDGSDVAPLNVDELRLLAPEAFACRTLALVPCHALIRNDFAITRLWSRLDQGRSTGTVAPGPETVLVWRSDVSVHHRRLGPREAQLLRLVAGGTTVERLCDQAATGTEVTAAAHEVFRFVQRWTADGLLSAVDHTDRRSHGGDP